MKTASSIEIYMLGLINAERKAHGLKPVVLERNLNESAEDYSRTLLEKGHFSHTGPDGSSLKGRVADAHFDLSRNWAIGENLAAGTLAGGDLRRDVDALHKGLMNSPGHRANILKDDFTHVGIGIERGDFDPFSGRPTMMITQNFGSSSGVLDIQIDGTSKAETLAGGTGDDLIVGAGGDDRLSGEGGADTLLGGSGRDILRGGSGNDRLEGGSGNDALYGDSGSDRIYGGAGKDAIRGGSGSDRIYGGSGNDNLRGDSGNDSIYGESGHDRIYGGSGNDRIFGSSGNDWVKAGTGNDTVDGGTGNDSLYGESGHDTIEGGWGNDRIYGGSGNDRISGSRGNDWIKAGSGNDRISGGSGNDKIYGEVGSDRIDGGSGNDSLYGGSDADTFVFRKGSGTDRIQDFEVTLDRLLLDARLWSGEMTASMVLDEFGQETEQGVELDFDGDHLILAGVDLLSDLQGRIDFI